MAGPVLGVDRIVLHGGIEPQPIALFTVVKRRFDRLPLAASAPAPAAPPTPAFGPSLLGFVLFFLFRDFLFRGFLGSLSLGRKLGGDQSLVLGSEIDLVVEVDGRAGLGVAVGLERLLPLERLDLLNGHLELVGDPCVRASLTHPGTDSVQLGS